MTPKSTEKSFDQNLHFSERSAGLLLHPSSLPGRYGIGDLGPELYKFVDFLSDHKLNLWQVLPLGPTGYADSPYQSFSAFAGNPMLISPENLIELNLLTSEECEPTKSFPDSVVDFGRVIENKWQLLRNAYNKYQKSQSSILKKELDQFAKNHSWWLEDYSVFMALKLDNDLKAWIEWDNDLRFYDPSIIGEWKSKNESKVLFQKFTQFLFFRQWKEAKEYTNQKGIRIIGDIPIFVAYDSVDVWSHPEYYQLDEKRKLKYVAGVPPDFFSKTGQRWGNPLYNWDTLKEEGYKWWIQRIRHCFQIVDILRIDHFRGFESYWQIPASEETARIGTWKPGPGLEIFHKLRHELGDLAIIAEDLGFITPKVEKLLQETGYPGMKILQFAFEEKRANHAKNRFLPHNYDKNSIAYTGTHDNQTTRAWFNDLPKKVQKYIIDYCNSNGEDIVGDLIRLVWSSVANMAVIPLQDLLRLGDEARMNFPGTTSENWKWRFTWSQLNKKSCDTLSKMSELYGRALYKDET
jgi:4-alpha-glucanotransferase